ncbi:ABC transporter substrate-binding protein [Sodalis ligni]|jgi:peptide/nickel transport system substrate-binding protein|uniref:Peptide/nickel transport system substrate-binding protein n=1 Tax=Sodalis ligni TaxID=2697027 RepID=A0A4R1NA17_9GAMM|nr:ABC transporter substrate-binding protein [Sodalis ligni]QWA12969.1 ABC transporter substrate-binding protein [Sodalis ligni]TCL03489.1 peptide/nickel transport system substrate-binding protein [Sodalis ligni]
MSLKKLLPFSLMGAMLICSQWAQAGGTLRIAMTLADIPVMDGAPDQGTEGVSFGGYTVFDPLIEWDLSKSDAASVLRPGLATKWYISPEDNSHWIFELRKGVKFHDGSDFNADAVIFNLERVFNKDFPAYDVSIQKQMVPYINDVKSWKKLDDYKIEIETKKVDAFFPYQMTRLLIASPAQWEKMGKSWPQFRQHPSGTGPWKLDKLIPHQEADLVPNKDYWDKAREPKLDRLVLLPIPEPSARTAALLSGTVDWIESPAPDTVDRLKKSGMVISTNTIPHVWPYTVSVLPGSPFADIRVRKAVNLGIDRDGMVQLLHGLATPATAQMAEGNPWYGNPSFKIKYDPEEAKRLLKEAGYGPDHPLKLKIAISTSGSGQMYPLMMNEFIQEDMRKIGVDLQFDVFEWEALRGRRRGGAAAPENKGIDGINNSWSTTDPYYALIRYLDPKEVPPEGTNWGGINDPVITPLIRQVQGEFDPAKQDKLLAQIHTRFVDQAYFIWVVHDVGSRAMSPNVQGYVHAQSWYSDYSPVSMKQ